MSRYNPKVFTDVDSLSDLDNGLLVEFLKRFPKFFAAHNVHFDNGVIKNEQLVSIFMSPDVSVHDEDETHELMEALQLITEMSHHTCMDALRTTATMKNIKLKEGADVSPADLALDCWLNHSDLFHTVYTRAKVKNYKSFSYFLGNNAAEQEFPEYTDETKEKIQVDLDKWFVENNRMKNCRVYFFPHGHRLHIVIKYGMPLTRDTAAQKNGDSQSIFYNPQKHDLLIYNRLLDEISVNTVSKRGQEPAYLRSIGVHLFENEKYFEKEKTYSLKVLEQLTNQDAVFVSEGITKSALVEVQYDWKFEKEIRKSSNLAKSLAKRNASESTYRPEIVSATFKVVINGKKKQERSVTIEAGNQAKFDRGEYGYVIEEWITSNGFYEAPKPPSPLRTHVAPAEEFAPA